MNIPDEAVQAAIKAADDYYDVNESVGEMAMSAALTAAAPFLQGVKVDEKQYVDCACTKVQQDESCSVGYPSLFCEICDGKGIAPSPRANALEEALRKMVALYESEYDADVPFKRPDWLVSALSSQPVAEHIADAGKMVADGCNSREAMRQEVVLMIERLYSDYTWHRQLIENVMALPSAPGASE